MPVPSCPAAPLTRQGSAAAEAASLAVCLSVRKIFRLSPDDGGSARSVQLTAQLMKRLCGMHVVRSRLHGSLELPKRIPPAPLLEIYAPKVHERELALASQGGIRSGEIE